MLTPNIDDCAVCYHDNILVYSTYEREHEEHLRKMLQQLDELGLYCKAKKCQFGVSDVGVLGFVINSDGIGMESDRIARIKDWPTPVSIPNVPMLLGFANCYQQFIRKYAKVTLHLTELLRTTEIVCSLKAPGNAPGIPNKPLPEWKSTREAELAFRNLKKAFTDHLILQHFDSAKPRNLETNATGFAIACILNYNHGFRTLRPVNFYYRKYSHAKQSYDTYVQKLVAIVETMKQW